MSCTPGTSPPSPRLHHPAGQWSRRRLPEPRDGRAPSFANGRACDSKLAMPPSAPCPPARPPSCPPPSGGRVSPPRCLPARALSPPTLGREPSPPVKCGKRVGQGRWPGGGAVVHGGGGLRCIFRLLSSSHCLPSFPVPRPARHPPSLRLGREPAPPCQGEKAPERGVDTKRNKHYFDCCLLYF